MVCETNSPTTPPLLLLLPAAYEGREFNEIFFNQLHITLQGAVRKKASHLL
jgi:hypothetical protein